MAMAKKCWIWLYDSFEGVGYACALIMGVVSWIAYSFFLHEKHALLSKIFLNMCSMLGAYFIILAIMAISALFFDIKLPLKKVLKIAFNIIVPTGILYLIGIFLR